MSRLLTTAAIILCVLFASASTAVLGWWFRYDPVPSISASMPGLDGAPDSAAAMVEPVFIGEFFAKGDGKASAFPGSWPRFRGEKSDNIIDDGVLLANDVPVDGFPIVWSIPLGEGHAGPAVWNGRVYVLDYNEAAGSDTLRCLSLDDGMEIWQRSYRVKVKMNHGRSRTVPAVSSDCIITIGPECHVMAVDPLSGDLLWSMDLVRDYGAETPLWYTGQCPLIKDGSAIIAVGGDDLLLSVDCVTGEVNWRVPNPDNFAMSHSSVMQMEILGRQMFVYCAIGGIIGVAPESGEILWQTTDFDARVIAPSPVSLDEGYIFATAGYGAGSILLQIREDDEGYVVSTVSRNSPSEGFACEQQTPLVIDGLLYGIIPKDGGALRNRYVCWNPFSGLIWASAENERYGLGPYVAADSKFVILSDDGILTLAEQSTKEFKSIGTAPVLEGSDSWAPMALVGGYLLARDSTTLKCIDLRRNSGV